MHYMPELQSRHEVSAWLRKTPAILSRSHQSRTDGLAQATVQVLGWHGLGGRLKCDPVLKDQQKGQALRACLFCCEPGAGIDWRGRILSGLRPHPAI